MKRLNLGAGEQKMAGTVTLDSNPRVKPDIVHDLDVFPWLLGDNEFDEVYCFDVLEHLENVVGAMEEIHRILKPGGTVMITTPHFSCRNAFTDPTHRHFLGVRSFDYFLIAGDSGIFKWSYYSNAKYSREKFTIYFEPSLFNKIVWRLANKWPDCWERRFAWLLPAWFMSIELKAVKS